MNHVKYSHKAFKLVRLLVAIVFVLSSNTLLLQHSTTDANRIQNNALGITEIDFETNLAGISQGTGFTHDPNNPGTLSTSGSAYFVTSPSLPLNKESWLLYEIEYEGDESPLYQILDCDDNTLSMLTTYTGPESLEIAYSNYDCLKSRVERLSGTVIDTVRYSWDTIPAVEIDMTGGGTMQAGSCLQYDVRWSTSYYDNPNTSIYTTFPYYDGEQFRGFDSNTINETYNQFPFSNLDIKYISDEGIYNDSSSTIELEGGIIVPPYSIYWLPDIANLGSTHTYSFSVCSDRGTQNGVSFSINSGIRGGDTVLQESNTVSTQITSTPQASVRCDIDNNLILAESAGTGDSIITYTFTAQALENATEDIFSPEISVDFSDVINDLQSCGMNESEAISRISFSPFFDPIGPGDYIFTSDPIASGAFFAVNNLRYDEQDPSGIIFGASVDYSGCQFSDFESTVIVTLDGDNIQPISDNSCTIRNFALPEGTGTIGDYVRIDDNNNGYQDITESGVSGSSVSLELCDDSYPYLDGLVVASGSTTTSGLFLFTGVYAGTYRLQFERPQSANSSALRTQNIGDISLPNNSDVDVYGGSTECFVVSEGENVDRIDAGISTGNASSGSGIFETDRLRYNKCMYTDTTNEHRYSGNLRLETDRQNIQARSYGNANKVGFYDNDCLGASAAEDYTSETTIIDAGIASGNTFYHINFDNNIRRTIYNDRTRNQKTKQHVFAIDRIDESYSIIGTDVYDGVGLSSMDYDTPSQRGKIYCSDDTSTSTPTINTGAFSSNQVPEASELGVGWSDICDESSRWVLAYTPCLNGGNSPEGTMCYNSPSKFQFRIYVEPTIGITDRCVDTTIAPIDVPNSAGIYALQIATDATNEFFYDYNSTQGGFVDTVEQQSQIIYTSLDSQFAGGGDIEGKLHIPSTIDPRFPVKYVYEWDSRNRTPLDGTASIEISLEDGACPEVLHIDNSIASFDEDTCTITTNLPEGRNTYDENLLLGSKVCSYQERTGDYITYDTDGNVIRDGNNFTYTSYTYNSDGTIDQENVGSFFSASQYRYTYTGSGDIDYIEQEGFNGDRYVQRDYSYQKNGVGDIIEETVVFYESRGAVHKTITSTFDNDGKLLEKNEFDTGSGIRNILYTYDSEGNLVEEVLRTGVNNNLFRNSRTTYTYDDEFLISQETTKRNFTLNTWDTFPESRIEYTYDEGVLISETQFHNDEYRNELILKNIITYYYDLQGRPYARTNTSCNSEVEITNHIHKDPAHSIILPFIVQYPESVTENSTINYTTSYQGGHLCTSSENEQISIDPINSQSSPTFPVLTLQQPPQPQFIANDNKTIRLITHKYLDTTLIEEDGEIRYTTQIRNTGENQATNIYIIDPLPTGVELIDVTLSGGTIPASTNGNFNTVLSIEGGTYSCPNNGNFAFTDCSVLFSNTPLSPELPNLSQPYTSSQITSTFTNGNNASGIRTPVISDVQYVSLKIPSLQPGQIATFQIRVRNTDNILGDIIANGTATIADNLLQSISNQVYTTVIQEKTNNIQGIVYHDGNHSQDYEVGETVFSGVSVSLYSGLTLLETQLTNSNGSYLFDKLQDGVYSVTYDASFTDSINPYVVNLGTIEALAAGTQLSLTQISSISLSNGQSSIDNDFGLASERLGSIAGTLYYDDEKDKIYDNDTGIQNIIVTLFVDGEMTRVGSTDRDGRYFFDSLPAGNYTIQYTTPSRYSSDSVRPGTISGSEVGDAPSLNTISEIILSAGDESIRNDFGLVIDGGGMVSSVPTPIDTPDTPQTPDETTPIGDDTPLPVQDIDTIPPYSEPETPFIAPDIETFLDQFSIPSTQTDSLESFRNTPKFLQTGVPLEEGMKNLGIETLYSPQVETRPPSRGIPHNSKDYPTELNYWLNTVLLPYDPDAHSAPIYVVIPESGYVIPVEVLEESNPSYQKMIMGEDVSISKDLQNVFAKGGLHHAGSQLPGKPGKNSIALHSSRYKDVPGIYTEGKYPTIGQILATLTPGDDVLYYVKEGEEYIQYTYEVENTLNTSPDNGRLLLAEGGYQSVLYTCTDFGGIDGRLYVGLRMKQENTDKELSLYNPLLYFSGVPQTLKKIINHLVGEIKDEKVIIKVWNNLAPYAQSTMNKNKSIEFIQYKLAKRYQELIGLVL